MNEVNNQASILEVSHLGKSFDGKEVLQDISFTINKGEVNVILGPSGCGKSTLLRCLNGLEPIDSGEIKLDEELISKDGTKWSEVRQKIGMVFQNYDLFPHMNVLNNIILGPVKVQKRKKEEASAAARKLLDRVGLLDKAEAYPRQLSGGQKQRVAIVRALILKPEILLFDEITAALDPEMVREVLEVMLILARSGSTMLIVTHEMSFARAVADRVLFMDEGRIEETASPEEFFTQPKTERAKRFLNIFTYE